MLATQGGRLCCLLAGVVLAGCATTSPQDPLSAANAHFNETVATGAAVGCAVGLITGILLAGNNRALGGAAGCGAGAVVGGAAGYAVASNNVAQAHTETDLNADIAAAKNDAEVAQSAANAAAQQAAAARAEAATLSSEVQAGQITLADYHSQLAGYQKTSDEMQNLIQHINQREVNYRAAIQYATPAQAQELGQSADQLGAAKSSLQGSYSAMQQALAARPAA